MAGSGATASTAPPATARASARAVAGSQPVVGIAAPDGASLHRAPPSTCRSRPTGPTTVTVTGRHTLSVQRLSNPVGCSAPTVGNPRGRGRTGRRRRAASASPACPGCACACGSSPSVGRRTPGRGRAPRRSDALRGTPATTRRASSARTGATRPGARRRHGQLRDRGATARRAGGCRAIAFGTRPRTDALCGGASDCFRFDAAVGDRVRTRVRADGPSPTLRRRARDPAPRRHDALHRRRGRGADLLDRHARHPHDSRPRRHARHRRRPIPRPPAPRTTPSAARPAGSAPTPTRAELAIRPDALPAARRLRRRAAQPARDRRRTCRTWSSTSSGPTASPAAGTNEDDCVLDATGAHTVLIRDTSWGAIGTYWSAFSLSTGPVGCTMLARDRRPKWPTRARRRAVLAFLRRRRRAHPDQPQQALRRLRDPAAADASQRPVLLRLEQPLHERHDVHAACTTPAGTRSTSATAAHPGSEPAPTRSR